MNFKLLLPCLILFFVGCGSTDDDTTCVDTNCADYTSQAAAQAAYNADPVCRGDLDADNDGIACEEPGNSVSDCNSTANCGCSNIRMADCGNNPCCKWVVGEGCKCK